MKAAGSLNLKTAVEEDKIQVTLFISTSTIITD
jgi:hypothetical protein